MATTAFASPAHAAAHRDRYHIAGASATLFLPESNVGIQRLKTLAAGREAVFTVGSGTGLVQSWELNRIGGSGAVQCVTCQMPGDQRFGDPTPDGKLLFFSSVVPAASSSGQGSTGGLDVSGSEFSQTQLFVADMETEPVRIRQLTDSQLNRIPWVYREARTGMLRLAWTQLRNDFTFHVMTAAVVWDDDGTPRLDGVHEVTPVRGPNATPVEVTAAPFAWHEVKGFLQPAGPSDAAPVVIASTIAGNASDDLMLDPATGVYTPITSDPEYDELVQWHPDNPDFFSIASTRGISAWRRILPFLPQPSLSDSAITAIFLTYIINFQAVDFPFRLWFVPRQREAEAWHPEFANAVEDQGMWNYTWNSFGPDPTHSLYTEQLKGSTLASLLRQVRYRTWLLNFDCTSTAGRCPHMPWPALRSLKRFAAAGNADELEVDVETKPVAAFAPTAVHRQMAGGVAGSVTIDGTYDLAHFTYDVTVTYDDFVDRPGREPVSGVARVTVGGSDRIFGTTAPSQVHSIADIELRRGLDDWFHTRLVGHGIRLRGRLESYVDGESHAESIVYPRPG